MESMDARRNLNLPTNYVRTRLKSDELTALLHTICSYDSTKLQASYNPISHFRIASPLSSLLI